MPITDLQLRKQLQSQGLDPDAYSAIDENQASALGVKHTEDWSQQSQAEQKLTWRSEAQHAIDSTGMFDKAGDEGSAAMREGLRSAPAGVSAGLAMKGIGMIPRIGPIAKVVGQAIGAALAGGTTRTLQSKAIENLAPQEMADKYKQSELEDARDNSVGTFIGGAFGGGYAGGMGISPSGLRNLLVKGPIGNAARAGAGIGAGLNVGIGAGSRAVTGQEALSPVDMLKDAATGMMFNKATKFGEKAYGLPSHETIANDQQRALQQEQAAKTQQAYDLQKRQEAENITLAENAKAVNTLRRVVGEPVTSEEVLRRIQSGEEIESKPNPNFQRQIAQVEELNPGGRAPRDISSKEALAQGGVKSDPRFRSAKEAAEDMRIALDQDPETQRRAEAKAISEGRNYQRPERFPEVTPKPRDINDYVENQIYNAQQPSEVFRKLVPRVDEATAPSVSRGPEIDLTKEVHPLEAWANKYIEESKTKSFSGLDPLLLGAYSIKGAQIIARGVRDFASWSSEMLKEHGPAVQPHLQEVWSKVNPNVIPSSRPTIDPNDPYSQHKISNLNPFKWIQGRTDKFRQGANTPQERIKRNYIADAVDEQLRLEPKYNGKYTDPINKVFAGKPKLNEQDAALLRRYQWDMAHNGQSPLEAQVLSNPKLKAIHDESRAIVVRSGVEAQEAGPKINGRELVIGEHYIPDTINQNVLRLQQNNYEGAEAKSLRKLLADFWAAKGDKNPEKSVQEYLKARSGNASPGEEFAALRREKGFGLPFEWVDKNPQTNLTRYFRRYAKDMAWHRAIESDPVARGILNLPDDVGDYSKNTTHLPNGQVIGDTGLNLNREFNNLTSSYAKHMSDTEATVWGASRAVTSGWMQGPSGVKDMASSPIHLLPYIRLSQLPLIAKGIWKVADHWSSSFDSGTNRRNIDHIAFQNNEVNAVADRFNKVADLMLNWFGRNKLEQATRGGLFSTGYEIANSMLSGKQDSTSQQFIRLFGKGVENIEQYVNKGKPIPEEVLNTMAGNVVERIQGTYDSRNLPGGAIDGSFAPLFSLARWNIEKANVMYKDVILPLYLKGDIAPLLKATIGSVVGGYAAAKLGQVINGRLSQFANFSELKEKPNKDETINTVANVLSYVGYFGIVGQMMANAVSAAHGQKTSNTIGLPLQGATQAIADNVQDFILGVQGGEPLMDSALRMSLNILKNSVQTARIISNHTLEADANNQKDLERNLKVFRRLEGRQRGQAQDSGVYDIQGRSAREFDRSSSLSSARGYIPGAISAATRSANGEPKAFLRKLDAIPNYTDRTLPSLKSEEGLSEAVKYKAFVQKVQGEPAWNNLARRYTDKQLLAEKKKALFENYLKNNAEKVKEDFRRTVR